MPSSTAHAYEVKHAESGELVRWHGSTVSLVIDDSVKEVPGADAAITAAIAAWSTRGGAPQLVVADHEADLAPGLDRKNVVFYNRAGFEPASGEALAVTILSFDARTGAVLDADVVLNGKYPLGVVDDDTTETYDIGRVVAHEMGHVFALGDELQQSGSLMYPYVPRAEKLAVKPVTDDVAGLESLYTVDTTGTVQEATSSHGCTGAVVARRGTRDVPGGALAAAGLLFGAVVLARSSRRGARGAAGAGALMAVVLVAPPMLGSPRLPASSSADDVHGVVTSVTSTNERGIFRSVVEVCDQGACSQVLVWGGTVDGVKQVIGGTMVPAAGERVRIALRPSSALGATARTVTKVTD